MTNIFIKCKTTLIFHKMEEDLNLLFDQSKLSLISDWQISEPTFALHIFVILLQLGTIYIINGALTM